MTKAEILEAINATIAPNNVKGITAESLANILTEIVNATPEGGSGGAGGEYIDMTLANPDDLVSEELSEEAKAHNAEVYTKLLTACSSVTAIPMVSVNMGIGGSMYASSVSLDEIEGVTNISFGFHLSLGGAETNCKVQGVNLSTSEPTEIIIGSDLMLFHLILHQDGSVTGSIPGLM
jgi:hypothetical protein